MSLLSLAKCSSSIEINTFISDLIVDRVIRNISSLKSNAKARRMHVTVVGDDPSSCKKYRRLTIIIFCVDEKGQGSDQGCEADSGGESIHA